MCCLQKRERESDMISFIRNDYTIATMSSLFTMLFGLALSWLTYCLCITFSALGYTYARVCILRVSYSTYSPTHVSTVEIFNYHLSLDSNMRELKLPLLFAVCLTFSLFWGLCCCPETSLNDYQPTLRQKAEKWRRRTAAYFKSIVISCNFCKTTVNAKI